MLVNYGMAVLKLNKIYAAKIRQPFCQIIPEVFQYSYCWSPVSLHHQGTSSHAVHYVSQGNGFQLYVPSYLTIKVL